MSTEILQEDIIKLLALKLMHEDDDKTKPYALRFRSIDKQIAEPWHVEWEILEDPSVIEVRVVSSAAFKQREKIKNLKASLVEQFPVLNSQQAEKIAEFALSLV